MRTVLIGPAALIALAALAACDGDNLFTEPAGVPGDPPRVLTIIAPDSIAPEDFLEVEATAEGEAGIVSLEVALRQGVVSDTTIRFDPPRVNISARALFEMPHTITDTVVSVQITAEDQLRRRSQVAERMIRVDDGNGTGAVRSGG